MTVLFYFAYQLLLFVKYTESVLVILTNEIFEFDKLIE